MYGLLGSGHSGEVATTSATMACLVHFINFKMGERTVKENIETTTIEIITNEEVARGFMWN